MQRGGRVQHAGIFGRLARRNFRMALVAAACCEDDQCCCLHHLFGTKLGPASEASKKHANKLNVTPSVTVTPSAASPGLWLRPSSPNDKIVVNEAVRMLTMVRAASSRLAVVSTKKMP